MFSIPYKCLTCYGTDFNRAPSADADSLKRKDDKRSTKQSGHPIFNDMDEAADTIPISKRGDSMKTMERNNNRSDLDPGTPVKNQKSLMVKRQPFGGVAYAKPDAGSSKQTIYKGLTTNEPTVPLQSDSNVELGTQKGNTHDAILCLDKHRGQTQEIKHVAKISKNSLPLHKQQESSLTEKINQSLGFRAVTRGAAAKEKSKFAKKTESKKRSRLGKEDVMNSMIDSSDSRFINDTSYFFSS